MKLAIFVEQFPVRSQTFVLNQVAGLIDAGIDITILSLNVGDKSINEQPDSQYYHLKHHTKYLLKSTEQLSNKSAKLTSRLFTIILGVFKNKNRLSIVKALNVKRYEQQAKSLLLASIVARFEDTLSFDVILAHFGSSGVTANHLRELGVLEGKIATIFHGYEISTYQALLKHGKNYTNLFTKTELMLPISELWKTKLIKLGCPAEKIRVHRMGVDLTHFQYTPLICNTKKTHQLRLFTVARFTEKKGLEYVIRALALLNGSVNFHYVLAGFGELTAQLTQLVNELSLNDKISFVGKIDSIEVQKQMAKSDVFLQPSVIASNGDMEGVPVAIMEAMAMGVPVISTYHSGIPELIVHQQHGLLAQEKNVEQLAENILLLSKNGELCERFSKNARERIEQMADVKVLNQQLIKILKEIV